MRQVAKELNLKTGQILAVLYADIFDFPLTVVESRIWSINWKGTSKVPSQKIKSKGEFLYLKERAHLMKQRIAREEISRQKLRKMRRLISLPEKVPTVLGIFLTGSVAMENASKESDIDLMIVTSPGSIWMTRLLIVLLFKLIGVYPKSGSSRDKICPNLFLDSNNLEIKEKNLYTAHEILQAKCLFSRNHVNAEWIVKNEWVKSFLPNAYRKTLKQLESAKETSFLSVKWQLFLKILFPFELLVFAFQVMYMWRKKTREKISLGAAFFHPRNFSGEVVRKFHQKMGRVEIAEV